MRHKPMVLQSNRTQLTGALACLSLLVLLGGHSAQAQVSGSAPALSPPDVDNQTLLIAPGDLLDIRVFDTPELSGKFRVSPGGTIKVPQGGVVSVAGLTTGAAELKIEGLLKSSQIMLDPHIAVFVEDYATQGIVVLGEVAHPGTYTLLGEHSLYGALSAAGGVTQNEGSTIIISHRSDAAHKLVIPVDTANFSALQQQTIVEPGDTVFVSRAELVYVIGDVAHQGAVAMPNGTALNLFQTLAAAQGANHTAALSKVSIIRTAGDNVQTIPVDLTKEGAGLTRLQPADILVIPRSGLKVFFETFVPNASTAVASAVAAALIIR